jgi:hypothetical protein
LLPVRTILAALGGVGKDGIGFADVLNAMQSKSYACTCGGLRISTRTLKLASAFFSDSASVEEWRSGCHFNAALRYLHRRLRVTHVESRENLSLRFLQAIVIHVLGHIQYLVIILQRIISYLILACNSKVIRPFVLPPSISWQHPCGRARSLVMYHRLSRLQVCSNAKSS